MTDDDQTTILVVDDNAENRALAQAALDDEGYRVILAATGDEGIRAFERERPACVLLDVRMPGTDGFTVCERIRALPGGSETPILFLTALRDVDTFDHALRSGGDDFLTKPVRPAELVARIETALKLRRLGAELREHYDLVRRQRDDLMRLQLQKERLTSFVVHDLKNPVNAMDLLAQLLLRDKELGPNARESVQRIREEARSLLRLVLNLLDVSKSEEGTLAPRVARIDLVALVAEVLEANDIKAKFADVTLVGDVGTPSVAADVELLRRVLDNLVDNAIRHAPEGSEVRVSAHRHEAAVEIRVADTGSGVPPEMRERIFERFVQLESNERVVARTGRGLGLAFCKLAIESHGGTLRLEEVSRGSVFCVRLPDEP